METLLDIRNLSLEFRTPRGRVKALRDVSFPIRKNRIVGIVGESGSGKSTILWAIMGLLAKNAAVTDGEILFQGRDMLGLDDTGLRAARGEEISVVFQDPMTSQIPVLNYARQMFDVLYRRPALSAAEKRRLAIAMMKKVGIPDPEHRIDQYPHHFSGGMRQRAGIGMALLTGPQLLLADEPTTALDVTMEAQIIHLMQELQSELNATIAVVSHNLGLIAELCDDVVVLYAGQVVETGDVRSIFYNPQHPYTRALLECDPARIPAGIGKLPVIPGDIPDLVRPVTGCIFAARCNRAMPVCATAPPPQIETESGEAACHLLGGPDRDPDWPPPASVQTVRTDTSGATVPTPPSTSEPVLKVDDLNVRFRTMGPVQALIKGNRDPFVDGVLDVSLSVRPGETLGLVGESGSGKTTMGRAVLKLLSSQRGSISYDGQDIRDMPESRFKPLRREMTMIFQDPVGSLSPRKTVRALIVEPFQIHGLKGRDLDREAERLADMVRLPRPLLSRYPHELSGGQARRVGVARALALNPKLIIADEPTAGLDVSVQGEILNLIADLQAEYGLSYLIITHNLPVVRHIADRLAIMYFGRIVEQGNTEDIFRHPLHPYTKALIEGVPQPDPDRRRVHLSISGEVPSLLNRPVGCEFATRCPYAQPTCQTEKPPHSTYRDSRIYSCHFPLEPSHTPDKAQAMAD